MNNQQPKDFFYRIALIVTLFILSFSKPVYSQPPPNYNPLQAVDSHLRAFFSPLCVPDTGKFLYEMSSHVISESFFSDNCTDTTSLDTWYKLYEEMRKMAYDTTWMDRHDTVYFRSNAFQKDTIMMDILCYNFYTLHDSALVTDTFFNFDTTNYTISDKYPCELYPYVSNRVFSSCPATYQLPYSEVTYRVDQDFIFHDQWNDFANNNWVVEIDFDDGAGWQMFNIMPGGLAEHYDASYGSAGLKYIKTRVFDPNTATYIVSSVAEVNAPSNPKPPEPSWKKKLPGVNIAVYDPCNESGEPLNKVIIYVEGYDPSNNVFKNRNTGDIYQWMIQTPSLNDLRNFGYTFVVVDWVDSRIDMTLNAVALQGVIEWLKCAQQITADAGTHEQFVIIAESMGGLVARYAMCDYEQNWQMMNGCLDEKMHNTRLLITFDSPNAGVNIPLAYQHLYRDAGKYLLASSTIMQAVAGGMSNLLLDGKSVKQMLLYHVDTRNPFTHEYTDHPDRQAFKTALLTKGNYPQYCKRIAMSNGCLEGVGQTSLLYGVQRTPNDRFLDWDTDVFARILGNEIQLFGTNVELRSTPNGSGNLAVYNQDLYRPDIRFSVTVVPRWPWPPRVRINFQVTSTYWFSIGETHHANNLEPYDVIPGSVEEAGHDLVMQPNGNQWGLTKNAINIFFGSSSPTFNQGSGTWTHQKAGGGVGRGNNGTRGLVSATFATDGLHFCYVPLFSSLDYNLGTDYWRDITAEPIGTKVAASPFHVTTGIVRTFVPNIFRRNADHLHVRNDFLGHWNNGLQVGDRVTYDTCQDNPHPSDVRFLNREIGDDTLWLNNREVAWTCLYDAEKYIGVDEENPYYEHPGFSTARRIPGIYSDTLRYNSTNGTTIFMVRSNINNIVFTQTPVNYSFVRDTIDWVKCCGEEGQFKGGKPINDRIQEDYFAATQNPINELKSKTTSVKIYPNPVTSNLLTVEVKSEKENKGKVMLYDMTGRLILKKDYGTGYSNYSTVNLDFGETKVPSGAYLILIESNGEALKQTIVIQ